MALIIFLLLPSLFVSPRYDVSVEEKGERGLPVYTIKVGSLLPVDRVTAVIRDHSLPVYEADARTYMVEPTRNGTLTIEVELKNRQYLQAEEDVTVVDANGPELIDSKVSEDSFCLLVADEGIGVDYRGVYAIGESGELYEPLSADEDGGIVFAYPKEEWDVYIPDYIGNVLHLSIKLN